MAAPTIRAKEMSLNQRIVAKEVKIAKINPFKIDIDISLKKILKRSHLRSLEYGLNF